MFGRVLDHWRKLNPDGRPTILFAPGVAESIWFVDEFARNGIRAAHIDGEDTYLDGETVRYFASTDDIVAAARRLLSDAAERHRLALAVHSRVVRPENTYNARLEKLLV